MAKTTEEQANEDAMPEDMASEALAAAAKNEEWEDVRVGLGQQWDFEKQGVLIGLYLGVETIELTEDKWQKNDDGTDRKTAEAHQFGLVDGSGEVVFVWGSYEIDNAMTDIGQNDKVKIDFIGRETFDGGKRQVKRYKVQKAVAK